MVINDINPQLKKKNRERAKKQIQRKHTEGKNKNKRN